MRLSTYSTNRASRGILDSSHVRNQRKIHRNSCIQRRHLISIQCQTSDSDPGPSPVPDKIPSISLESDWRSFRAQLVTESRSSNTQEDWAHALTSPELGCLLLAHPLMFNKQQTYFNLAVIFLFVHGDGGSAGLILNKPTRYRLGDFSVSKDMAEGFEQNTLFLGGDVGDTSLHLIHKFADLERSIEVIEGVYINGFDAAQKAVLKGTKKPSDFNWYTRYCGWKRGQLEEECKKGVWFPVACSTSLIVKERCFVESPADDWHQIMQLMGEEHEELSNAVLASCATDITRTNLKDDKQD